VPATENLFGGMNVVLSAETSQIAELVGATFCLRDDVVNLQVLGGVASLFRDGVDVLAGLRTLDDVAAEFCGDRLRSGFAGRRLWAVELFKECCERFVEDFG
jgi:hypothetical protein